MSLQPELGLENVDSFTRRSTIWNGGMDRLPRQKEAKKFRAYSLL